MKSVHSQIESLIRKQKPGRLIFLTDFRHLGTQVTIRKVLSRLADEHQIKRLARGMYYIPKYDPMFGELVPSIDTVLETISNKEGIRIRPAGAYAAHRIGLTTQVPTKQVYITDGNRRTLKIGNTIIQMKSVPPKKLQLKGDLSSLIISALDEMDLSKITFEQRRRISTLLNKEERSKLLHDMKLTSARVSDFLFSILHAHQND